MSTPLDVAGAVLALGVAAAAAWAQRRVPPAVDEARWLALVQATLWIGRIEASGGGAEDWKAAVRRFVPYHPAGRLAQQKVLHPEAWALPADALPGERSLVEALRRLPDAEARWRHLFDEDPAGLEARLEDPATLGTDWDPARWLGPEAGWAELASWEGGDGAFATALARQPLHWGFLRSGAPGRSSELMTVLAQTVDQASVWELGEGTDAERAEGLRAQLVDTELPTGRRWVWVADGHAAHVLLRVLAGSEGEALRDHTSAVLAIGGALRLPEHEDWMGHHYSHVHLDTDARRLTPYLSVAWLDREAPRLPEQRFGPPCDEGKAVPAVDPVDLGVLPDDPELPLPLVARALATVVALAARVRA